MTVREAVAADIPDLVALGAKFHAMSPHRGMGEYDPEAVSRVLRFMIEGRASVVLTNDKGLIGGTLSPVYFNPAKWQLEESFWFADAAGRELLSAFVEWGRAAGASFVMLSTLADGRADIIDKLLNRKGFTMLERRYVKDIA